MANKREIRRRIRSVQSTAKITNALQLVAASKMRRAQEQALAARPYSERLREVLADLSGIVARDNDSEHVAHPLLDQREVRESTVVLVTPDRGLCGGLIANLHRHTGEIVLDPVRSEEISMIPVGRKGLEYFHRFGVSYRAEFDGMGDHPALIDTLPISRIVIDDYTRGAVDQVLLVYGAFVSTAQQRPITVQLLPVQPPLPSTGADRELDFIFEPTARDVLSELLPRFVEIQIYQAVLEAAASEQSARMVAMRNATDAANEMVEDLTLQYNKARQEQITSELLDIVGGVEAMAG